MKVPSTLLKAMLITATLGVATGCKVIKSKLDSDKVNTEQGTDQPRTNSEPCPACGMG